MNSPVKLYINTVTPTLTIRNSVSDVSVDDNEMDKMRLHRHVPGTRSFIFYFTVSLSKRTVHFEIMVFFFFIVNANKFVTDRAFFDIATNQITVNHYLYQLQYGSKIWQLEITGVPIYRILKPCIENFNKTSIYNWGLFCIIFTTCLIWTYKAWKIKSFLSKAHDNLFSRYKWICLQLT